MEVGPAAGRVLLRQGEGAMKVGTAARKLEGNCSIRLCPALIAQLTAIGTERDCSIRLCTALIAQLTASTAYVTPGQPATAACRPLLAHH